MKKFLSLIVALIVTFATNICSAYDYDNDPDYYYVMSVQGSKTYLYLPSIDVQEYNPPHYQIKGKFLTIGIGSRYNTDEYIWYATIRYNWYTREAFEYSNGSWRKMCTRKGSSAYAIDKLAANALFRAAYGMTFYDD